MLGFALAILGNLLTLGTHLGIIFVGLLIVCFGNWLVQGLAVGYVATATRTDRAGANALYLLFYYIGGSLGGYLPGLAFPISGYSGVVVLSVAALTLGLLSAAFLTAEKPLVTQDLSAKEHARPIITPEQCHGLTITEKHSVLLELLAQLERICF